MRKIAKLETVLYSFLCVSVFSVPSVLAQVNIIQAPSNYQFVDMGYDVNTDTVAIVGSVLEGTETLPTVFELNAEEDGFIPRTLTSLPGATEPATVNGISSDASRVAGSSSSTDSIDFEGVTWLRSTPDTPTGIGFIEGQTNRSQALGAWRDGIVGEAAGTTIPAIWTQSDGIQELIGTNTATATADDVSSNGQIVAGFSGHEVFDGAAYFWDSSGINRLNDNIEGYTLIQSRANSISPDGNFIGGEILASDSLGNFNTLAVVWEGANKTQRILTDSEGIPIQGSVSDVSDLGFAVGFLFDADFNNFAFIENPASTNGAEIFEDWLQQQSPDINLPFTSGIILAIASGNGKLFFTVAGTQGEFALVETVLEEALLGDFDGDGDVDLIDLDRYNQNLGAAPTGELAALDLDGDNDIDEDDFTRHYECLVETSNGATGTFAGDLNLDGTVNVLDDAFGLVANLGNSATSWSQGDFSGDGTVNVLGDAFSLVGNLGMSNSSGE